MVTGLDSSCPGGLANINHETLTAANGDTLMLVSYDCRLPDELTTLRSKVSTMHDRVSLSYRFRTHKDRRYVIEQRSYADVVNGKITNLNLVCSGFRPA